MEKTHFDKEWNSMAIEWIKGCENEGLTLLFR